MTTISRRAFAGLTLAAAVGTTAACGRDSSSGGADTSAEPIKEGKATGSLTVWAMGAEGEKLPDLVKGFTKDNPDCTVDVTAVPWDSAHDKFTSAIAAGTAPDVAQVGSTWMAEFVGLKALEATPKEISLDGFFDGAVNAVEVDGTAYGVPWYVETRLVFYRKDLAEQAGITEPPTDWDGLKQMATAMKEKAGAKWGIALQPGGTGSWQTVLPLMWSNGSAVVSEDGKEFTFEDDKNVEALTYYQSYFTDGVADPAPAEGTTSRTSPRAPCRCSSPARG